MHQNFNIFFILSKRSKFALYGLKRSPNKYFHLKLYILIKLSTALSDFAVLNIPFLHCIVELSYLPKGKKELRLAEFFKELFKLKYVIGHPTSIASVCWEI